MQRPRTQDELAVSKTVSTRVKNLRAHHGWSLRTLADRTVEAGRPISYQALSVIEQGAHPTGGGRSISVDELVVLARVFTVPVEALLTPPKCSACLDSPPPGFSCRACEAEA